MPKEPKPVVLVADDEPSTVAMLSSHLRTNGYTVLEAADGDQAWELAYENLPDLVLLDVMMPGMSGWEVCRKIREAVSLAHTGVIMLTGIGENLNEMTSPLYGADAYLDKPFEFSDLDQKISETLARRSAGALGRADGEDGDHANRDENDDDAAMVKETLRAVTGRKRAKEKREAMPKAAPAAKPERAPMKPALAGAAEAKSGLKPALAKAVARPVPKAPTLPAKAKAKPAPEAKPGPLKKATPAAPPKAAASKPKTKANASPRPPARASSRPKKAAKAKPKSAMKKGAPIHAAVSPSKRTKAVIKSSAKSKATKLAPKPKAKAKAKAKANTKTAPKKAQTRAPKKVAKRPAPRALKKPAPLAKKAKKRVKSAKVRRA